MTQAEPAVDGASGTSPGDDGLDHRCRTGCQVTAGEHERVGCGTAGGDGQPAVGLDGQPTVGAAHPLGEGREIGSLSDG